MKINNFARMIAAISLALPAGICAQEAEETPAVPAAIVPKPIILVLSQQAAMGETERLTGFHLAEASHPWQVFHLSGFPVLLASPKGGFAPLDPSSFTLDDPANKSFMTSFGGEVDGRQGVLKTASLTGLKASDYSAIFFAGGHGAMWDFPSDPNLQSLTAAIYEQGGAVGAVCHGPAALTKITLSDGSSIVNGKNMAAFTNAEEKAVKLDGVVPFSLQDLLTSNGAKLKITENFKENAVLDDRLATGQNPASATKTAELLVQALGAKPAKTPEPEAELHEKEVEGHE